MPLPGNTSSEGKKPTTPVIGTATAGDASASVPFTPSTYIGKGSITYYATSTPGSIQGTNTTTPISVTGLTNSTTYTFVVNGVTNYGVTSDNTAASNSVTPAATPPPTTPPPTTPPPTTPPPTTPPPTTPPPTTPPPTTPPPTTPPPCTGSYYSYTYTVTYCISRKLYGYDCDVYVDSCGNVVNTVCGSDYLISSCAPECGCV